MKNNLAKITQLVEEYQRIKICQNRVKSINSEIHQKRLQLQLLNEKAKSEYRDIVNIEKLSLRGLFIKILKNKEAQLEKENQEYLQAILEYNDSKISLEALLFEKEILEKKVTTEHQVIAELEYQIEKLEEDEYNNCGFEISELRNVNSNLKKLIILKIEAMEALEVAQELDNIFQQLTSHLHSAQESSSWGKFYHEIQEEKARRKESIDKASQNVINIKRLLFLLQDELEDVLEFKKEFNRTEVLIRSFNLKYYQYLIEDWVNDSNLSDTLKTSKKCADLITKLNTALHQIIDNTEKESTLLTNKRNDILEKL